MAELCSVFISETWTTGLVQSGKLVGNYRYSAVSENSFFELYTALLPRAYII